MARRRSRKKAKKTRTKRKVTRKRKVVKRKAVRRTTKKNRVSAKKPRRTSRIKRTPRLTIGRPRPKRTPKKISTYKKSRIIKKTNRKNARIDRRKTRVEKRESVQSVRQLKKAERKDVRVTRRENRQAKRQSFFSKIGSIKPKSPIRNKFKLFSLGGLKQKAMDRKLRRQIGTQKPIQNDAFQNPLLTQETNKSEIGEYLSAGKEEAFEEEGFLEQGKEFVEENKSKIGIGAIALAGIVALFLIFKKK